MSGESRKSTFYFSELSKRGRSSMTMVQQKQQQAEVGTEMTKVNEETQQLKEKKKNLTSENEGLRGDLKKLEETSGSQRVLMEKIDALNKKYKQEMTVAETKAEELKALVEGREIEITELSQLVEKLENELALHSKNPFDGNVQQHKKKPSGMWLEDLSTDLTDIEKQNAQNETSAQSEAQEALALLIRNNPNMNS